MNITVTTTMYINTDEIIEKIKEGKTVEKAINSYIWGLDDSEFYLLGDKEIEQIKEFIEKELASGN